jgi:hypothetical protein
MLRPPALPQFVGRATLRALQAIGHVVEHRLVWEQRVVLEDHADVALVGRHGRHVVAVEEDAPAFGCVEAGDAAQQRGLAAAAGAQQREEAAVLDDQVQVLQDRLLVEALDEVLDAYGGHGGQDPPAEMLYF